MMIDDGLDHDYVPKRQPDQAWPRSRTNDERYAKRYRSTPIEPGQDFQSMTAKHGRPVGPFERDRQHGYNGGKP
jgi:hypothetical protein